MSLLLLLVLTILLFSDVAQTAKIIMASPQIKSHILEQLALAEELSSRGHEVFIAIGSRYPNPEDFEQRGIRTLKYHIPEDVIYGISIEYERDIVSKTIFDPTADVVNVLIRYISEMSHRDCAFMLNDTQFIEKARKSNFDLAIIEPFILSPCNLILPKYLNIPFVSLTPFFLPWDIRIPGLPSLYPLLRSWTSSADVTFLSRLENFFTHVTITHVLNQAASENTTLLQQFAPEFNSWNDLLLKSELMLWESGHQLTGISIEMPYYISVGGLTAIKSKSLPDDLETIFQESHDGVILLSFGSIANYFPKSIIETFLEVFSKLNQTVVARFAISEDVLVPKNVKILSWLPQNDILGHRKTRLFITHCGNNGQHEALYHGVPMIGFPLFAEQEYNCERARKRDFGLQMNILGFTANELFTNIQEILNNPKYRSTIKKASEEFQDQPMHPRERAAFWVEHVIRHGGKHLRSLAMDMPLYQLLMLDILAFLLTVLFIVVLVVKSLVRCFIRLCLSFIKKDFPKYKSQ